MATIQERLQPQRSRVGVHALAVPLQSLTLSNHSQSVSHTRVNIEQAVAMNFPGLLSLFIITRRIRAIGFLATEMDFGREFCKTVQFRSETEKCDSKRHL